jgi:hypothetical protein
MEQKRKTPDYATLVESLARDALDAARTAVEGMTDDKETQDKVLQMIAIRFIISKTGGDFVVTEDSDIAAVIETESIAETVIEAIRNSVTASIGEECDPLVDLAILQTVESIMQISQTHLHSKLNELVQLT